ncbi:MAG: DNA polymerase IV [Phycisphaeraceae bacterium]|nr:DNA polymerase IV [Phycisphaeraceae bacterium]
MEPIDPERCIFHVDMDGFFAAIEQLDRPELRGKPVLVGSDRPRGVVSTASYEARRFGCHSAQPMVVAKRRCPDAIVVPVRGARYREASRQVFAVFDEFTPLVEPLSIDEAFLDMTGSRRLFGPERGTAERIKRRIVETTGLTASVGIAPNKFLAKLASDLEKPDGLTIIRAEHVHEVLDPLPVTKIWGVGPATAARFESMGIRTIGQLRRLEPAHLRAQFGRDGDHYHRLASGRDRRRVVPDSAARSVGHEQTFERDIADPEYIRFVLLEQVEQVARRLRRHGLFARGLTVKIRYGAFQTITRSATLEHPTQDGDELWQAARSLFDQWASASFSPVRLIGASAASLSSGPDQMELFGGAQRQRRGRLDAAKDEIKERFGGKAIRRGMKP